VPPSISDPNTGTLLSKTTRLLPRAGLHHWQRSQIPFHSRHSRRLEHLPVRRRAESRIAPNVCLACASLASFARSIQFIARSRHSLGSPGIFGLRTRRLSPSPTLDSIPKSLSLVKNRVGTVPNTQKTPGGRQHVHRRQPRLPTVLLAVLALLVRYAQIAIPVVSHYSSGPY
jgi:hypothetical protein